MSETKKRILTSVAMVAVIVAAALLGYVQWLAVAVAVGMGLEVIKCKIQSKKKWGFPAHLFLFFYYILFVYGAYSVGNDPMALLIIFIIIAMSDIGAWFFGTLIGGDKMWERLSHGKTWSGQIAGIMCGTLAGTLAMYMLTDFIAMPTSIYYIFYGMGVALLSQYGDLAASAIKRNLGIKDFGKYLPGHGGLMDRFDGWIFIVPIIWLTA